MDINIFNDPNKVPQPKDNVKIEHLAATPYADGYRIAVDVHVTAFQERPNLLLVIRDEQGEVIHELDIIAAMQSEMTFTVHMRGMDDPRGTYSLEAELFYETRRPPQDKQRLVFVIPAADANSDA